MCAIIYSPGNAEAGDDCSRPDKAEGISSQSLQQAVPVQHRRCTYIFYEKPRFVWFPAQDKAQKFHDLSPAALAWSILFSKELSVRCCERRVTRLVVDELEWVDLGKMNLQLIANEEN